MKTQANINGVTVKQITGMMQREEKRIAWFNQKYNYGTLSMPAKDQKQYDAALQNWDFMKAKRDQLSA